MKKLLSIALATAMCMAMSISAFAVEPQDFSVYQELSEEQIEQLGQIAYMSLDGQSEAMQAKIVKARNAIIFNNSWVSDEAIGYVKDVDGNIIEELPKFSELFPEDWEVPSMESSEVDDAMVADDAIALQGDYVWNPFFEGDVNLKKPPANTGSPAFYSLPTTGFEGTAREYNVEEVSTSGLYQNITVEATWNCGYTNKNTNKSYGYKLRLGNGQSMTIIPPKKINLAVHASTHDSVGSWLMWVYGKCVNVD